MGDKNIIELDYGFRAYECNNFYEELKDFLNFKPANLAKNDIEKNLRILIKLVVIDSGLWSKLVAFWKKRLINLSYGFYDINRDLIFINIKTCGINATKDCKINTHPSTTVLKRLSEIIVHEYIHYKFQHDTFRVLDKVKQYLLKFYKTYWENIVDSDILPYLYRAHYYVCVNTNKNIVDPTYGRLSQIQLERFIRILENIQNNHKHKINKPQTFSDSIETIRSLISGYYFHSDFVTSKILKAYKSIVNTFPPRTIQVGQELIYASEILAVCANIQSSRSYEIVRKVIKG